VKGGNALNATVLLKTLKGHTSDVSSNSPTEFFAYERD
jgi:hypothetical protein